MEEFGVRSEDNDKWNLSIARDHVRSKTFNIDFVKKISWRPFEDRWIVYDDVLIARTNRRVLGKLQVKNNVAIVSVRQLANIPFFHEFVSDKICDQHFISTRTKEGGVVFPLHSLESENLGSAFRAYLDARYDNHYSPEEILGYIYAVLHAPAYRSRYAEFLRIDFPRIPFAETRQQFEALSVLGWALVDAHLMRELPQLALGDFHGRGGNEVEHVRWSKEDRRISINATQSFAPVPEYVWNFHIGGYQVLDKYLKSRKGRVLSLDEINHIPRICDALAFTTKQMAAIDIAYLTAFPAGGKMR